MEKLKIKVKGMMCTGCENRVKNALTEIEGIENVEANHTDGTVKVISSEEINMDIIKEKIEDLGFEVI